MPTSLLKARTEFAAALNQICAERGISPDSVMDTIKSAILAAYRKDFGIEEGYQYEVKINPETGAAKIYRFPEPEQNEELEEEREESTQGGAIPDKEEITPPGFGRIAAQTAKQVILQRVREAEKEAVIEDYQDKVGTIVNGMVLRFEGRNIVCDIGRGQGLMPAEEQIRNEKYRMNQRLVLFIKEIREFHGTEKIIVSRTSTELVAKLFRKEVPEVNSGAVEIKKVAREAGSRSKVAVESQRPGVDPVGSCVGQKGVRVQAVIDQIGGEKIDIVPFSEDPKLFIAAALSPAEDIDVEVDEEDSKAVVKVPEDQLSLAIGKDGQNVRLATKLTGYKIDIEGKEVESKEELQEQELKEQEGEKNLKQEEKEKEEKNKSEQDE
jgi:N utilization substance protein A